MSEAQLVFLLIVPMSSDSWYVRVQTTPYIHGPTGNHGKKLNAALWWNTGWNMFFYFIFFRKEWVKTKREGDNSLHLQCALSLFQRHNAKTFGCRMKSWVLNYLVLVWGETLKTFPFKSKAHGRSNSTCKHLICPILPFLPGVWSLLCYWCVPVCSLAFDKDLDIALWTGTSEWHTYARIHTHTRTHTQKNTQDVLKKRRKSKNKYNFAWVTKTHSLPCS